MGVDTKLYLNTRWQLEDIKDILERTQKTKVKVESHHSFAPGYFTFNLPDMGRMIHVHTQYQTAIGSATLLTMASNEQGKGILRAIADCTGGLFMDNDVDDKLEEIRGRLSDDNALQYFLKYAVIHDGIGPDNIEALQDSMSKWYDGCSPDKKPQYLIDRK